ncbi:hypothetical protein [sulfur-oxidizing endosymbiont of Gigantopelta aegis]|uniref:hypothetical protein n=1 Tax=sulfur-oxidizing endosymbiont of Gigantopelta aegis TaxID=2794934 RepID=UPI0018DC0DAD|nr:hypothetical protein [sulfur-oxidizing endosymbiont of Gigantopelta aegis]
MKKILLIAVLLNTLFVLPVFALDISHFTQSEYAFNLQEPEGLNSTPGSLAGQREKLYDFINFEPGNDEKLVTYLDTPDRILAKNSLIIRVREDLRSPRKTRITVKLRAESPADFGDIKRYRKAEIDIVGGNKSYSVSWDIRYNHNDINVRKVNILAVLDRIKKKNPEAWNVVETRLEGKSEQLIQTLVMRTLSWEGPITKVRGIVEMDYTIWSPLYKENDEAFTSMSFKGKTKDKNLLAVVKRVDAVLAEKGLAIPPEKSFSKTRRTFDMSPGFKQ